MKILTDFRKTVETGMDPRLRTLVDPTLGACIVGGPLQFMVFTYSRLPTGHP